MITDTHTEPTITFIAEWFDSHPQVTKRYLLKFYPTTMEVEMKDTSTRTKFLKRTKIDNESLTMDDFHLGATVILFSRDLKLVEYGDNGTKELLEQSMETSIVVLTPRVANKVGYVVKRIEDAELTLVDMKSFQVENDVIAETSFVLGVEEYELKSDDNISSYELDDHQGTNKDDDDDIKSNMNFCIAIEFRGANCIQQLLEIQSSLREDLQKQLHLPPSLQQNNVLLLLVASPSSKDTTIFKDLFLRCKHRPTATFNQDRFISSSDDVNSNIAITTKTCCVMKPHIIKARQTGSIMNEILTTHGLPISAIQMFYLDRPSALEFYEAYKTAVNDYTFFIDEICSGPILAMEIKCDTVRFREDVAGPWDVEMAKSLCPDTIRAKYGVSNIQNAIHCTDLVEEVVNELSYFFDILQSVDNL